MKSITLHSGRELLVDDQDFDWVSRIKWYDTGKHAQRQWLVNGVKHSQYLHCMLMSDTDKYVDHIDGNGLNNQTSNLRTCTHAQNMKNQKMRRTNKSGFKGVSFYKQTKRWVAYVRIGKKSKTIGYYDSPEEAAKMYDSEALKYYGEFARTNEQMGLL
jgi:AP2 domain/HNH endonuclease